MIINSTYLHYETFFLSLFIPPAVQLVSKQPSPAAVVRTRAPVRPAALDKMKSSSSSSSSLSYSKGGKPSSSPPSTGRKRMSPIASSSISTAKKKELTAEPSKAKLSLQKSETSSSTKTGTVTDNLSTNGTLETHGIAGIDMANMVSQLFFTPVQIMFSISIPCVGSRRSIRLAFSVPVLCVQRPILLYYDMETVELNHMAKHRQKGTRSGLGGFVRCHYDYKLSHPSTGWNPTRDEKKTPCPWCYRRNSKPYIKGLYPGKQKSDLIKRILWNSSIGSGLQLMWSPGSPTPFSQPVKVHAFVENAS